MPYSHNRPVNFRATRSPPVRRHPEYSILDNYMMRLADGYQMADWKDALDVYMAELK